MQNLLRFLVRYYHIIYFVALEVIALRTLITFNNHHQSVFFSSTSAVQANLFEFQNNVSSYFNLRNENKILLEENTRLRQIDSLNNFLYLDSTERAIDIKDSNGMVLYSYLAGEVINNSTTNRKNYFTINSGSAEGVEKNMGVITPSGIGGKIVKTSEHYSLAMSVLHEDFIITPKIGNRTIYGGMVWEGEYIDELKINKVNSHYDINAGDSVFTSGFSHYFPANILIGTVRKVVQTDANYQEVWVKMSNDVSQMRGVYLVKNHFIKEINELEQDPDEH